MLPMKSGNYIPAIPYSFWTQVIPSTGMYSPKYDTNGFVNKDYLVGGNAYATLYVKVPTGYLALRSAMGYDAANEIGELNTGDTVVVIDSSSDKYWYVYSPRLMKYGYADCNYIFCN